MTTEVVFAENWAKPNFDDKGCVDTWSSKAMTGTISNDSVGTSEENSQDCTVMPIWKDTSYLDSPTKNVDNGEPNC
ncbi:hypothetical protein Tco_1345156 [Tanacetum coccineum]